jgi:hypothetical protein
MFPMFPMFPIQHESPFAKHVSWCFMMFGGRWRQMAQMTYSLVSAPRDPSPGRMANKSWVSR